MRINPLETASSRATTAAAEVKGGSGEVFMQEVQKVQRQQIDQNLESLVKHIEEAGERLAATMSLDDLFTYKRLIGDFVRTVNHNATQVSSSLSWGYMGQQRHFTIVREIDKQLIELREMLLEEEKDHLAIVAAVDQIRGLILDLRG